jgi:hypothetical protein
MGINDLAFKFIRNKTKKLTLLKAAGYFFIFAVCAKMVCFVEANHPSIDKLTPVQGVVREKKIGGEGSSTFLKIETQHGINKYSSYYGKDWSGLEAIRDGDRVDLLVEKDRLNKNELFSGKQYYIWELTHHNQKIIRYEDIRILVEQKDVVANRFINIWMIVSAVFLVVVYVRNRSQDERKND